MIALSILDVIGLGGTGAVLALFYWVNQFTQTLPDRGFNILVDAAIYGVAAITGMVGLAGIVVSILTLVHARTLRRKVGRSKRKRHLVLPVLSIVIGVVSGLVPVTLFGILLIAGSA